MEVEVPVNTSASIHVPGASGEIRVNGHPLTGSGMAFESVEGETVIETGSGKYNIVAVPAR